LKQTAILPHDGRFILPPAHPATGLALEYPAREMKSAEGRETLPPEF